MKCFPWLIALISVAAVAVDYDWSKWQQQCRPGEHTQVELNQCAQRQFQARDAELNRVYKSTLQSLPAAQQERLRKRQRTWLQSRDPACRAQADAEAAGGSIWPMLYELCRAAATERRTQQLRGWTH